MSCPLCRARKAKRACPALGETICAVCCGTKRLTTIACPPDCVYLESAHRHPAASVKRQQERDLGVLMGALGPLSEHQLELFFVVQTFIMRFRPTSSGPLGDADVAGAVGALAASFETSARGVIYEHQAASPTAEELRRGLKSFLAEIGRGGGTRFETQAAEVLRGIERGASHEASDIGGGSVDYLTLVARILREQPPAPLTASPIIWP
jgi:hypothetical protein